MSEGLEREQTIAALQMDLEGARAERDALQEALEAAKSGWTKEEARADALQERVVELERVVRPVLETVASHGAYRGAYVRQAREALAALWEANR